MTLVCALIVYASVDFVKGNKVITTALSRQYFHSFPVLCLFCHGCK
jgi:hypothetical protein